LPKQTKKKVIYNFQSEKENNFFIVIFALKRDMYFISKTLLAYFYKQKMNFRYLIFFQFTWLGGNVFSYFNPADIFRLLAL